MKHPVTPSALDRLREAFRPPQSFGATAVGSPKAPPAASIRASPDHPGLGAAGSGSAEDPWNESAFDPDAGWPATNGRVGRLRIDPGLPGVRVLALAGLLAALLAGAYLWWSRPEPHPAPQPIVRPAAQPATAPPLATGGSAGPSTPSPSPSALVVDVAGKVRHPGVVSLTSGARVIDAIKEAGGLRPGTTTGTLNLARRVVDGEQILVGIKAAPAPVPPPTNPSGPPGAPEPGTPIDLNAATVAQLDQLPGVGPVLAQRIVDYRTQHSGFHSVDELRQVSGIGESKFADLKSLVRV
jgi:competence protein ComEA